jgi:hypothetical protein
MQNLQIKLESSAFLFIIKVSRKFCWFNFWLIKQCYNKNRLRGDEREEAWKSNN